MKSDDRRLLMSHILAPFPLEEIIKNSTSIHRPTPVGDQVSVEKWFGVKAPSIRNSALPSAIGFTQAGKQSTTKIRTEAEENIKTKNPNLVKSLSAKQSLITVSFTKTIICKQNLQLHHFETGEYKFVLLYIMSSMNFCQTVHRVNDPDQEILIDLQ